MRNALAASSTLALIALATSGGAAPAAERYDGNWLILAVTESGPCDKAYRFPVMIAGGHVTYAGTASTTASGSIDGAGRVKVDFTHGDQRLMASGSAKADGGAGNWTSKSCKGSWTAERR